MKSKLTTTLDTFVMEKAKNNNFKFSEILEEAVRLKLNLIEQNIDGVDLVEAKIKLEAEEKKLMEIQTNVSQLRTTIQQCEESINKKEIERLEDEKEKIRATKTCYKCGNIIGEAAKKHKLTKGIMCNGCFLTLTPEEMRELR